MAVATERRAEVKARTTSSLKSEAQKIYADWGLSLSDAINLFLVKTVQVGGLPFDLRPVEVRFEGLRERAYKAPVDAQGIPILPAEWDDDDE